MKSPNQIIKQTWECDDGMLLLLPFRLFAEILIYPVMWLIYLTTNKEKWDKENNAKEDKEVKK